MPSLTLGSGAVGGAITGGQYHSLSPDQCQAPGLRDNASPGGRIMPGENLPGPTHRADRAGDPQVTNEILASKY